MVLGLQALGALGFECFRFFTLLGFQELSVLCVRVFVFPGLCAMRFSGFR